MFDMSPEVSSEEWVSDEEVKFTNLSDEDERGVEDAQEKEDEARDDRVAAIVDSSDEEENEPQSALMMVRVFLTPHPLVRSRDHSFPPFIGTLFFVGF